MLIDNLSKFALPTALSTAAPATAKFGDAINLVKTVQDLGEGTPLYWFTSVAVAATSGGSATLTLQLVEADNEALTTNPEVLLTTAAIPVASLTLGAVITNMALPKTVYRQWIGLRQVVGTAAFTAGSLNSFLTTDTDNWRALADGVN